MAAAAPSDVILIIADISGYTKFMLNNAQSLAHAQTVITSLMEAVVAEAKLPFVIAKLEGDAVFMYALRQPGKAWERDRQAIRQRLSRFYGLFQRRLNLLRATNTCGCGACAALDQLSIKFVVHAGQALLYKFGRFDELAGPDVILVHRLLKNSVVERTYLLVTAAAFEQLGMAVDADLYAPQVEHYDDVGDVAVLVDRQIAERQSLAAPETRAGAWAKLVGMALRMWAMIRQRGRSFGRLPS